MRSWLLWFVTILTLDIKSCIGSGRSSTLLNTAGVQPGGTTGSGSSSSISISSNISSNNSPALNLLDKERNSRSLAVYALYNLPSFAVAFTTTLTEELRSKQQEGPILADDSVAGSSSLLSYPLRSITQEALKDHFLLKLNEAIQETPDDLPPMYTHLVAVDLQTKIHFSSSMFRDQDDEGNSLRRRHRNLEDRVTLVAEMYGTVAFLEPHLLDDKPSNEQVRILFGGWLADYFANHRDDYLQQLQQSDQPMLQDISQLAIQTDIDDSKSTTVIRSDGWSSKVENALLACLVLLGVMAIAWVCAYARRKRLRRNKEMKYEYSDDAFAVYDPEHSSFPNPMTLSFQSNNRQNSPLDSVRHGPDSSPPSTSAFASPKQHQAALSVLEASDRYLSKHRPDLFDSSNNANSAQPTRSQGFTPINNGYSESHSFQMLGRNYVIPSNPFEYIYDAASAIASSSGLVGSPNKQETGRQQQTPRQDSFRENSFQMGRQGSFRQHQMGRQSSFRMARENSFRLHRQSSLDLQKDNIATTAEEDDLGYVPTKRSTSNQWMGGYKPISSIWRNLSTMFDDVTERRNDGMVSLHDESEEEISLHQFDKDDLIGAEPEEEFPFAFKDFPRHDGTPCLIFDENAILLRKQQKQEQQSPSEGNNVFVIDDESIGETDSDVVATIPVSDDAFKRMLSQQGADASFDEMNDSDECIQVKPGENPFFMGKLDRIVAQRHRQYEKKSIVERHQEARAKERAEYRERERRERHKAMEREIEAIENSFSPLDIRASPNKRYLMSPKRSEYSPRINQYSPNRRSPRPYVSVRNSPSPNPHQEAQGIFRRSPHLHSPRIEHSLSSPSARSTRSFSPPGGFEDMDFDPRGGNAGSTSGRSHFPKERKMDNSNVDINVRHLGGSYHMDAGNGGYMDDDRYLGRRFDVNSLDKLSIPEKLNLPPIGLTSQMQMYGDEMLKTPSPYNRKPGSDTNRTASTASTMTATPESSSAHLHRRVHSFTSNLDAMIAEESCSSMDHAWSYGDDGKYHHRRTSSGNASQYGSRQQQQQLPPQRQTPTRKYHQHSRPHKSHRRSNSQDIRRTNSHGGHSRSNSNTDDVMIHGIYAQTRFV